jgi:hypothetical protein
MNLANILSINQFKKCKNDIVFIMMIFKVIRFNKID